jgi:hypothetical protein
MTTNRQNHSQTRGGSRGHCLAATGLGVAVLLAVFVNTARAEGPAGGDRRPGSVTEFSPAVVASILAPAASSTDLPQADGSASALATGTSPGAWALQVILALVLGLVQFIPRSDSDDVHEQRGPRAPHGGGEA